MIPDRAREVARRVRDGTLRAVDVAREHVARVHARNPALNAIVRFDAEPVLAEAAAVDARVAAGEVLPLAGVPFTAKDNLWVGGRRVSQGSRLFADFVAPRDAWAVARLRSRGAVLLGITNCSEFACRGVTTNPLHGTTRHPLDATLTPGGSSGGAAAALAAGLGLIALGTDAGGSVRRPAAHCGLVGLKPSAGLVPHPWGFAEPNTGQSVVGLLAHDAADCALAFDALAAFDAADPVGVPLAVALHAGDAVATDPPRALRLAWSPRLGLALAIDDDVLAALQARIDRLRVAGWAVVDADPQWPPGLRTTAPLALQHAALHALHGHRLAAERDAIDPDLVGQIEVGAAIGPEAIASALHERERASAALARFWDRFDVLLCPTVPVVAWPLGQSAPAAIGGLPAGPRGHAAFTPLFNAPGVPACSVPAGMVRDLPVALQVTAPRYADARVLQLAALLERIG